MLPAGIAKRQMILDVTKSLLGNGVAPAAIPVFVPGQFPRVRQRLLQFCVHSNCEVKPYTAFVDAAGEVGFPGSSSPWATAAPSVS